MMLLVNQAVLVTVECAATFGDGVGSSMDTGFTSCMSKELRLGEGGFFQLVTPKNFRSFELYSKEVPTI